MTTSPVAQRLKNLPAMCETQVQSLDWEDPLEKGMVTHSSILAWRIPLMRSLAGNGPWGCKELSDFEWLTLSFFTVHLMTVLLFLWRRWCWWNQSWTATRNRGALVQAVDKLGTVVTCCSFISSASSHLFLSVPTPASRARPLYFTAGLLQHLVPMPLSYFLSHFFSVIQSDSSS